MSDPVYMEMKALMFLREWPNVRESLRPVYARFLDAGLIYLDPNVDETGTWPSQLRLTHRGDLLKEIVDGQSFNFFTAKQLAPIMPHGSDPADPDRRIFKDRLPNTGLSVFKLATPKSRGDIRTTLTRLSETLDKLIFEVGMNTWRNRAPDDLDDDIPF
jgi:hypothetical protein